MNELQDGLYYKGYIAGYRDGIEDALNGRNRIADKNNILNLPIKAMSLSMRASNCLRLAGCIYIADVAALNEQAIATMRRLGVKTASEIAHWLDEHGICYSAWSKYL
ncbi:MAG: hypothetical protein IJO45_07195 [Oscillospiraceae bacterium]|nr:hypothetical protein [Oscillospiraceae bacterium]